MLFYHIKIGFRILQKNSIYSLLSIVGLSTAMFIGFFLFSDINRMLAFDKCHKKHSQIYRVISNSESIENFRQTLTPYILASTMKQNFPEIAKVAHYTILPSMLARVSVKKGEAFIQEDLFYCADQELFDILTIPLLTKESEGFLSEPDFVVISNEMAIKYFKESNPVGQMLEIRTMGKIRQLRVTAVMENLPENSTFQADFIASTGLYLDMFKRYYPNIEKTKQSWTFDQFNLMVLLKEGSSESETNAKLDELISSIDGIENYTYDLQKLTDVYLHSHDIRNDFIEKGEISELYIFTAIAFLILLVASINYVILTTARLSLRNKEIGIKKVFGISKSYLMLQIIIESTLVALASLFIALLLVFIFKDHSELLLMNKTTFLVSDTLKIVLLFIGLALIIGILSGLYISVQVALLNPVEMIKSRVFNQTSKIDFKKVLIGFQLMIFVILLIYSSFIYKQVRYALNANLGYDPENMLVIYLDRDYFSSYDVYVNSIKQHVNILSVSGASSPPPTNTASYSKFARVDDPSIEVTFESDLVDYNFFKTLNIKILEGRTFSREYPTDAISSIIINKEAVDQFGIKNPIGKKIGDRRIIGVVDNFNVHSFHKKILPSIFTMNPMRIRSIILRINPANQDALLEFLESKMKEIAPDHPFKYIFIKPELRNFYSSEINFGRVISMYTFFSILISTLGLFGLSMFVTKQKSREVTIRKVHGANTIDILKFFLMEYLGIIIIANIIAWPLAFFIVDKWLQDFPIRISIADNFWLFLVSGLISAVFVLATVGIKAIYTSLSNPVKNLKYE